MAKCRLSKRHQTQAIIQAELYEPDMAQQVGYLDQVAPEQLHAQALQQAAALAELPNEAYANTKLDVRRDYIDRISASLAG